MSLKLPLIDSDRLSGGRKEWRNVSHVTKDLLHVLLFCLLLCFVFLMCWESNLGPPACKASVPLLSYIPAHVLKNYIFSLDCLFSWLVQMNFVQIINKILYCEEGDKDVTEVIGFYKWLRHGPEPCLGHIYVPEQKSKGLCKILCTFRR
jgi:hypothetical protein